MKLLELKKLPIDFQLIFEAKDELIVKQFGPQLIQAAQRERQPIQDPAQIVSELTKADPFNGRYIMWIAKMYAAQLFRLEDTSRIRETLSLYDKIRPRLNDKGIMSYQTVADLYRAVKPFENAEPIVSNRQNKKTIKERGVTVIIDTPGFKIIQPITEEAACIYGAQTKWCTAATKGDNMFDHYNQDGPLYIILAGDRKFQLHYESDQFVNEEDEPLTKNDIEYLSKYPQYKDFLNMMINKHYGL